MRGADGADRRHSGRVVEHHPTAAIDLAVDEAGQEPAAAQVAPGVSGRRFLDLDHPGDESAAEQYGLTFSEAGGRQDLGVDERGVHQTVSVILLR